MNIKESGSARLEGYENMLPEGDKVTRYEAAEVDAILRSEETGKAN
jgi:hypothetical protein